jgi:hypothetical protein
MRTALRPYPTRLVALMGVMLAMSLALLAGAAPQARATLSNYCGNQTLSNYNTCYGAPRTMYAVFGWGDQHSVCVGASPGAPVRCSGGPGEGVYDPFGYTAYLTPFISDNAAGSNVVHGVAYQP